MIALSFSRWKDADCPFRFNALHIARTYKEPANEPMLIGGEVAEILKEYRLHCFKAGVSRDVDFLWKTFDQKAKTLTNSERTYELLQKFEQSDFSEIPVTASCVLIEKRLAFDENLNLICEEKEDDAWFSKKAVFRLISDSVWREGDTLQIIDEKTGFGDPDPLQLEIAAYLLPKAIPAIDMAGVFYISGSFNILSTGKRIDCFQKRMDELGEIGDRIRARVKEVNSWTEFPARACGACKYCSVPDCPLQTKAKELIVKQQDSPVLEIPAEIKMQVDARMAIRFVSFAERIIDQIKGMLRDYVEANGPISVDGKIAELRPNEPWKATNLEQILKTLVAYGIPPKVIWDNMSLSESDLSKILKKAGMEERKPMLLSLGERKAYKPRFGIYNDKL